MAQSKTWTARETAADVQAVLSKAGVPRTVNAKRVRAFVRDTMPAYDDGLYTAHLYDARTHDRIVRDMTARYVKGRPASASLGRSTQSKSKSKTPATPATTPEATEATDA